MTNEADWQDLADRLDRHDDYRVLRRVPSITQYAENGQGTASRLGLIVDVETTGLDPDQHKIIELAVLPFHFSPQGALFDVLPAPSEGLFVELL